MTLPSVSDCPTIAGYELLRVIGRGSRSTVWLGTPRVMKADDGASLDDTAAVSVAVKVISNPESGEIANEIEALERAQGPHIVTLHDVDVTDEAVALVCERLRGDSLADLLRERQSLDAGEAVTILAPVAEAIVRLHAAGVAHGSLRPSAIHFRSDGAPTLVGFARAELWAPGSPEVVLEKYGAVARDRESLRAIAVTVLMCVTGSREKAARILLGRVHGASPDSVAVLLAHEIFEIAAAVPVRAVGDIVPGQSAEGIGGRIVPVTQERAVAASPGRVALPKGAVVGVVSELLERGVSPVARSILARGALRHWHRWSTGRRRMTLAVCAAGAAVIVTAMMIPNSPSGATPRTNEVVPLPTISSTPAADSGSAGAASDRDEKLVHGDDPLAALTVLLRRRRECYGMQSMLCLDAVDQAGSSALSADQTAIRGEGQERDSTIAGSAPPPAGAEFELSSAVIAERFGDSALVDLMVDAQPASLLLMRSEAGWRIRDYLIEASH